MIPNFLYLKVLILNLNCEFIIKAESYGRICLLFYIVLYVTGPGYTNIPVINQSQICILSPNMCVCIMFVLHCEDQMSPIMW